MNLIENLPRASNFWEAYSLDEEIAEVAADSDSQPRSERMSEWTPEVDKLASVLDMLSTIAVVLIKAHGGKASRPPIAQRPETALQRVRDRIDAEKYRELVDRITPKR